MGRDEATSFRAFRHSAPAPPRCAQGNRLAEKDYAKARQWYEKAAVKGDATAKAFLEKVLISEAVETGRYTDALKMQEVLAARVEAEETKREGKPGNETAEGFSEPTLF